LIEASLTERTMSRRSRFCVMALIAAGALASGARLVDAQGLRVRLIDEEAHQPLAGALVSALNAAGASGPAVLSSADGIATVRVPDSAPHRLLIRRIGFAPVTTEPVAAPVQPAQVVDVVVVVQRITLSTVRVTANQSCSDQTVSPSLGAQAAWTAVRTALEASTLTRDQRLVTTAALSFRRQLGIDGKVQFVDTTLRGRSGERPFFAPAPAVLERDGYYRKHDDGTEDYSAPDEPVLLSEGFARLHCVSVASKVRHDSTGTEIALAFVPRDRSGRPDIRGVIWVDSATSELRRIDFEYVRISFPAPADSIGGSVQFTHLASGAWIVSSWVLRMPRWRVVSRRSAAVVLDRYEEIGGSASVVRELTTPGANVPRSIVGSVFDSVAQRPLSGARVHLADLGREVVADSMGAFRFDSVGVGVHTVWADHSTLDTLGIYSLGARVDVTPQAVTDVALAVPSFATLWQRACGADLAPREGDGFVFGRLTYGNSARAQSGATIEASWRPRGADGAGRSEPAVRRTASPDSSGSYAICGIPGQQTVTLSASAADTMTIPVSFRIEPAGIARRDFTLPSGTAIEQIVADVSAAAPLQPRDGATLVGVVHDSAGQPVRDARITVSGVTGEWRANSNGGFVVRGIPSGTHVVAVNALGFVPNRRLVDLAVHDSAYLAASMTRLATMLSTVRVVVDAAASGARAHTRTLHVLSADGWPLAHANVSVDGGAPKITDEKGELGLGAGAHRALTVRVTRIGYTPYFGTVELPDTAAVVTVMLPRLAQTLAAVTVTGATIKSPLELTGFYDRWMMRQKGVLSAVFIGPEEIESRHPDFITNMLYGLNGVCLLTPSGHPRDIIAFAYVGSQLALKTGGTCPNCPMAIVIDGMQQYPTPPINTVLDANDVMAIEVYARGGNMPISMQFNDTKCGVIAIWTGSRKP
jgi:hypothetical protein